MISDIILLMISNLIPFWREELFFSKFTIDFFYCYVFKYMDLASKASPHLWSHLFHCIANFPIMFMFSFKSFSMFIVAIYKSSLSLLGLLSFIDFSMLSHIFPLLFMKFLLLQIIITFTSLNICVPLSSCNE